MTAAKNRNDPPQSVPADNTPEGAETGQEGGLVRKLSPRTVIGTIPVPKPGHPLALFNIFGIARGVREGESTYGAWKALTGTFVAVRLSDGVEFQGPQAFLPEPSLSMVTDAVLKQVSQNLDPEVKFALQIGVKHIKKRDGTDGYEYTTQTAIKPEQTQALNELREATKLLSHG